MPVIVVGIVVGIMITTPTATSTAIISAPALPCTLPLLAPWCDSLWFSDYRCGVVCIRVGGGGDSIRVRKLVVGVVRLARACQSKPAGCYSDRGSRT